MNPALPNLSSAIKAWFMQIDLIITSKSIENFEIVESTYLKKSFGVRQPLSPQKLAIKPEGQRSWKWQELHLLPDTKLNIDDVVKFDRTGEQYRVIAKEDFSQYGYIRYELAQGFE